MTTKFEVNWSTGRVTTETSEAATPAAYAMERWGLSLEEVNGMGTTLTVLPDDPDAKAEAIRRAKQAAQ